MSDIERMAREAGAGFDDEFQCLGSNPMWLMTPAELERFAALIRAEERERCAKVCEDQIDPDWPSDEVSLQAQSCADAIRALT